MRMNHINLTVPDVQQTRVFLETYFGLSYLGEDGRSGVVALVDDDAHCILTLNNFGNASEVHYPKAFHIGFFQPSRERVDEMYARLDADGFKPKKPKEMHGAWTFYMNAPGGFTIEIGAFADAFSAVLRGATPGDSASSTSGSTSSA